MKDIRMRENAPGNMKDRDRISSLERGLRVLRVFDQDSTSMTPAEVARRTDLPRAATRRILLTLCELGYASTDGKHFQLTPKVLDLSHGYLAKTGIRELVEPILRDAMEAINDSCILAIRDNAESISVACCNAVSFGAVAVSVGLRIPLHVSTPGRVFLADLAPPELASYLATTKLTRYTPSTIVSKSGLRQELARIHEQGYAIGREEWELGVYALAVPVKDRTGRTIASVGCVGNVARVRTDKSLDVRLAALRLAASRVRAALPESPDSVQELSRKGR